MLSQLPRSFYLERRKQSYDTTTTQMTMAFLFDITMSQAIVPDQVDVVMPKPQSEIECHHCSVWGWTFELADNLIA